MLALILGLAVLSQPIAGDRIYVRADAQATYTVAAMSLNEQSNIEITTRRQSSFGVSYARREVDCGTRRTRYLGEGDSFAAAQEDRIGNWSPWVSGSSTGAVSEWACRNQSRI
jgi:hypothetical protein